jgi:hypothetical protein
MIAMSTLKKFLMGFAAVAALALGGAALAGATANNGDGDGEKADDGPDAALTGAPAAKAGRAATAAVGGGKVVSVERSDEGGSVYEVKVAKAGTTTEVQLDKAYAVTSQAADDDQGHADERETGDGDGEDPSK